MTLDALRLGMRLVFRMPDVILEAGKLGMFATATTMFV